MQKASSTPTSSSKAAHERLQPTSLLQEPPSTNTLPIASIPYTTPSELTTFPESGYLLLLREVDVVANDQTVVLGAVDPGSQIVATRKDLDDIATPVSADICIEMEGENGSDVTRHHPLVRRIPHLVNRRHPVQDPRPRCRACTFRLLGRPV
jgi:hypothetical protein